MSHFECSIDACSFETDSPLGMTAHSRMHRNRFETIAGRPPESYAEVRALFNGEHDEFDIGEQTLLESFE